MKIQKIANAIVFVAVLYLLWPPYFLPRGDLLAWGWSMCWRLAVAGVVFLICKYSDLTAIPAAAISALDWCFCELFFLWSCELDLYNYKHVDRRLANFIRNTSEGSSQTNRSGISYIYHYANQIAAWTARLSISSTIFTILCTCTLMHYQIYIGVFVMIAWWIWLVRIEYDLLPAYSLNYEVELKQALIWLTWMVTIVVIAGNALSIILADYFDENPSALDLSDTWLFSPILTLNVAGGITLTIIHLGIIIAFCLMAVLYARTCASIREFMEKFQPFTEHKVEFSKCPHCNNPNDGYADFCAICHKSGVILTAIKPKSQAIKLTKAANKPAKVKKFKLLGYILKLSLNRER